jgi:hypothetical protein
MGWTLDNDNPEAAKHHGWAAAVLDTGNDAILDALDSGKHYSTLGWNAACECGWISPHLISRVDYPSPDGQLAKGSIAERLVLADWESHVRPLLVITAVADAERARARASRVLDDAVNDARRYGHSWQAIGDAVGITRQSARERWG